MTDTQSTTLDTTTFLQLQEEERQRLAQALTSGPGQLLANTLTEIEYALPLLEKNPQVALAGLNALRQELRDGLRQLQDFVAELQPPLLDEMGLGASIQRYVQKFGERTGIRAECSGCPTFQTRFPRSIELALFRAVQESLANVAAHAKATQVQIDLRRGANHVRLEIQDNGRGFAPRARHSKKRPLGLIIMRDRVEWLGGQLQLFSENGRGVRVVVTIPYHGHAAESSAQGGQETNERDNHHAQIARNGDTNPKKSRARNTDAKTAPHTRAQTQRRARRAQTGK